MQTAHEKTITGLIPALGGANQIYGAGMIESGVTIDYGVLVMDNEIARMVKYILRGIPTNDETLMVDEIIEVGSEEDFLSRMSTLKLMRAHQSKAGLIDRRVREEWEMDGGTDLYYSLQREGQGARGGPQGRGAAERRRGPDQGDRREEREGRGSRLKASGSATNPRRGGQRILWQTLSLSRR